MTYQWHHHPHLKRAFQSSRQSHHVIRGDLYTATKDKIVFWNTKHQGLPPWPQSQRARWIIFLRKVPRIIRPQYNEQNKAWSTMQIALDRLVPWFWITLIKQVKDIQCFTDGLRSMVRKMNARAPIWINMIQFGWKMRNGKPVKPHHNCPQGQETRLASLRIMLYQPAKWIGSMFLINRLVD